MASNRKLYRSIKDRKLAGVCGGLAEFFGLDATIIRVLWVVISFFLGFFMGGLIIYLIVALIVPNDPGYTDV